MSRAGAALPGGQEGGNKPWSCRRVQVADHGVEKVVSLGGEGGAVFSSSFG